MRLFASASLCPLAETAGEADLPALALYKQTKRVVVILYHKKAATIFVMIANIQNNAYSPSTRARAPYTRRRDIPHRAGKDSNCSRKRQVCILRCEWRTPLHTGRAMKCGFRRCKVGVALPSTQVTILRSKSSKAMPDQHSTPSQLCHTSNAQHHDDSSLINRTHGASGSVGTVFCLG